MPMATLTIYLDEETLSAVNKAAKTEAKSVSGWAKEHLRKAARTDGGWPEGFFETIKSWGGTDIEEPEDTYPSPEDISSLDFDPKEAPST